MSSGNGVSGVAVTTVWVMMSSTCGVLGDGGGDHDVRVVVLDMPLIFNAGSMVALSMLLLH
jgi:hypothetical protein